MVSGLLSCVRGCEEVLMSFFAVVGCNELIFNPIIEWWRKGPINKQLHTFMWSAAPVHYKVSMTSYMFSYCECSPNFSSSSETYEIGF